MTNKELRAAIRKHKAVFVTVLVANDTVEVQAVKKDLIDLTNRGDDNDCSGMSAFTIDGNLHLGPDH